MLSLTLSPIYDEQGQVAACASIARDITARKHAEEALQALNLELEARVTRRTVDLQTALAELQRANRLKDEFLAMISHELRTPLTGVLSLAEMLAEQVSGPLTARQAAYVKGISDSGERLLQIVNGILSYIHLISGKVELQPAPCELRELLANCALSQEHKLRARGQAIAVVVDPPELTVTCDAAAVAEVLKRLLDNAIKFTPAGGRIGLEAHGCPGTVDLVVWDTGAGIAPEQLAHLLKPFTQADGRLTRSHEGIGLGLAYVDQMVRLLGGTLALTSEPGCGSRFTITLPAA